MFDGFFWRDAGSRAIKTFAQATLASLGTGSIDLFNMNTNLLGSLSLGAGAALVSLLMSLASEHKASKPPPE